MIVVMIVICATIVIIISSPVPCPEMIKQRTRRPFNIIIISYIARRGIYHRLQIRMGEADEKTVESLIIRQLIPLIFITIDWHDVINGVVIDFVNINVESHAARLSGRYFDFFFCVKMFEIGFEDEHYLAFVFFNSDVFHIKIESKIIS